MKKILIIGGAGYIGGATCDLLKHYDKYFVGVLDNLLYENRYLKNNVKFYNVDVRDKNALMQVVKEYDCLVILAGLVGDAACKIDPQTTKDININHVQWLADEYQGQMVYASTCSVYGKNDNLLDENSPTNPLSLYAETKLIAEEYLKKTRPDTCIFRLGTLFGTGDLFSRPRLDLVVNLLTMRACNNEKLSVFGGEQWRPLLHVKDVARAIEFAISNKLQGLYNLLHENKTLRDVATRIVERLSVNNIEYSDMPFEDLRNYRVDNSKLSLNTEFKTAYSLDNGIDDICDLAFGKRIKNFKDINFHNGNYLKALADARNSNLPTVF